MDGMGNKKISCPKNQRLDPPNKKGEWLCFFLSASRMDLQSPPVTTGIQRLILREDFDSQGGNSQVFPRKTQGSWWMGVSKNMGKPTKLSILIGFSIINHPFWVLNTAIFGNIHMTPTQTSCTSFSGNPPQNWPIDLHQVGFFPFKLGPI